MSDQQNDKGEWIHDEDGTPCAEYFPLGARFGPTSETAPDGSQWWCPADQSYITWRSPDGAR